MSVAGVYWRRGGEMLLLLAMVLSACSAGAATGESPVRSADTATQPRWQETPFPPSELQVFSNGATAGILRLRFENLQKAPPPATPNATVSYLIAGRAGHVPSVEVEKARYRRVRQNELVEILEGVPPVSLALPSLHAAARITEGGLLRQYATSFLTISTILPVGPPAANDDVWLLESLELKLDLGPAPRRSAAELAQTRNFTAPDRATALESLLLLNPDIDPAYYEVSPPKVSPEASRWTELLEKTGSTAPVYRMRIYKPGVYRVTSDDLRRADAGSSAPVSGAGLDLSSARLYRNGTEIPCLRPAAARKVAGSSDGLLFTVQSADVASGQAVFWLLPGSPGNAPSIPVHPSAASADLREQTSSSLVRFQITEEHLKDYSPKLRGETYASRWFWTSIQDQDVADLALRLPETFAPSPGQTVTLNISYGFPGQPSLPPALELIANGHADFMTSLSALQGSASFSIPGHLLRAGDNKLAARLAYANTTGERPDVMIGRLTASWTQPLGNVGRTREPFTQEGTTPSASLVFGEEGSEVTTSGKSLLIAWDTPSPFAVTPVREGGALKYALPPGSRGPFRVAVPQDLPGPGLVERYRGTGAALSSGPADYVAVAPSHLQEALRPLLARRAAEGLKTAVVDPQDLYDRHSFGAADPRAIRAFLQHAFYTWSAPKLRYVLLVGEASDYKGDPSLVPPATHPDLVPVFGGSTSDEPRGDHPYTLVAGTDPLSDISLGRLPVKSAEELTKLLEKMRAYEEAPLDNEKWPRISEYVYDDNEEFPRAVEDVLRRGQAPPAVPSLLRQSDHPYVPNPRVTYRKRSHAASQELLRRFDRGASVMTFFGHGGPNLWSHERMLHLADVPSLDHAPRLPFITCASCDNSWLDYPVKPVSTSIGEMLVTTPQGGAIGLFGPVSGASPYEHQTLMGKLLEGIYRRQIRRMGDASTYAKNLYFAEARSPGLPLQYVLVGDPALSLRIPRISPTIRIEPAEVAASKPWQTRVTLPEFLTAATTGVLSLRSLRTGEQVMSGPVALGGRGGRRAANLQGPALKPDSYAFELTTGSSEILYAARLEALPPPSAPPPVLRRDEAISTKSEGVAVTPLAPFDASVVLHSWEPPQFYFRVSNNSTEPLQLVGGKIADTSGTVLGESPNLGDVAAGETRLITIPGLRPMAEGETSVTVQISVGSPETSHVLYSDTLGLRVLGPPRLEFLPGSAESATATGKFVRGETVLLRAVLHNRGQTPAKNVMLRARIGDPVAGAELKTLNDSPALPIDDLGASETRRVSFRWEDTRRSLGGKPVYLTADVTPRLPGEAIASIPVPGAEFEPAADFALEELTVSESSPSPGTTITVTADIAEVSASPRRPVEVEFTVADPYTGFSRTKRQTLTGEADTTSVVAELPVDRPYASVTASVNGSREWEEETFVNNERKAILTPIVPVRGDAAKGALPLSFEGTATTAVETIPGQGFRVPARFPEGEELHITTGVITQGRFLDWSHPSDFLTDAQWSLGEGHVHAFESESAGELALRFPVPKHSDPLAKHHVILVVAASPDPNQSKAGSVEVRVENEPEFRTLAFQPVFGGAISEVSLGAFPLQDDALDLNIRQTSGTQLLCYGVRIQPLVSELQSAAYRLAAVEGARPLTLKVTTMNAPDQSVRTQVRVGESGPEGVSWSDWSDASEIRPPSGEAQWYLQWRCFIVPAGTIRPMLQSVELRGL